jgi:hypothetical protein
MTVAEDIGVDNIGCNRCHGVLRINAAFRAEER